MWFIIFPQRDAITNMKVFWYCNVVYYSWLYQIKIVMHSLLNFLHFYLFLFFYFVLFCFFALFYSILFHSILFYSILISISLCFVFFCFFSLLKNYFFSTFFIFFLHEGICIDFWISKSFLNFKYQLDVLYKLIFSSYLI